MGHRQLIGPSLTQNKFMDMPEMLFLPLMSSYSYGNTKKVPFRSTFQCFNDIFSVDSVSRVSEKGNSGYHALGH